MEVLLVLVGVIALFSSCKSADEEWESFKASHSKQYADETDDKFRMNIFMDNKQYIDEHNLLYEGEKVTFQLALNEYADLLPHEYKAMNGRNGTLGSMQMSRSRLSTSSANGTLPDTVDWRSKGAVTPVKNQGNYCGSCWAFSATGALEGQMFRKTGVLVPLSEQYVLDCCGKTGCDGGLADSAFKCVKINGGIDTDKTYPYVQKVGACRYKVENSGATCTGYVSIDKGNEKKLKEAIATIGPIAASIDASHRSFQFYSSGVYHEPECRSGFYDLDHAMLAVGYGSDNGLDYWIVKNSWGTSWGEKGYIRMARNKDNNCGTATDASYPLL